jgi:hypothetical protein
MEKDLGKNVLEKIKEEKIQPKPKWIFSVKDLIFWAVFTISLILGSISTSLIIFILRGNDWDLYERLGHGLFKFVLITLPYFWLIFLVIFIVVSYYNFKNTKSGYKYNPSLILLANVLISIFLGSLIYICGLGAILQDSLERKLPPYQMMFYQRHEMWNSPEKGLVAGVIISFEDKEQFEIMSLERKRWEILGEDAVVAPRLILEEGERIKVIGERINIDTFRAEEIRPFIERRLFFERNPIDMRTNR